MQDGVKDHRRSISGERWAGCGHLVENRAEREQVGAGIKFFPGGLLRRHVGDRAHGGARAGQMDLAHYRRRITQRTSARRVREPTLASPKSRILACPRLVTKIFAGLMSR